MAHRKINQEVEKTFKQVNLGVDAFDEQHTKYEQSGNPAQREKIVDNLKRECKKLQRFRDQIKTWAAGNEIKDKGPLLEKRELIESKMEAFKAIEKEMKTKTFSKEGLAASTKLDPKDKDKNDVADFLNRAQDELEQKVEQLEAEIEGIQGTVKKSKKANDKAEKLADREQTIEKHKEFMNKLDILKRSLLNDGVDVDEIKEIQDSITYYVENHGDVDFVEDDTLFDAFDLEDQEDRYGVHRDVDRVSSQDNQSLQDEASEPAPSIDTSKSKSKQGDTTTGPARRPSQPIKSPLPTLATMQPQTSTTTTTTTSSMKPAPPPAKPPGEPLKYASAAAAAAASDKANVGIAPLPPAPSNSNSTQQQQQQTPQSTTSALATHSIRSSTTSSPVAVHAQLESSGLLTSETKSSQVTNKSPAPSQSSLGGPSPAVSGADLIRTATREEAPPLPLQAAFITSEPQSTEDEPDGQDHDRDDLPAAQRSHEDTSNIAQTNGLEHPEEEDESIYHLPASLQELVESYDAVRNSATSVNHPDHQRALAASFSSRPDTFDAERPRHYKPENPLPFTPLHFPQEPLPIFDHPKLYEQIDTDSLFYSFYYRQGTYQQYLAARALKKNSWRFHKQYQTWFQRHEEPKTITEDYEQGTYRFFDYESTWMNRRKQDFKFAYKFLEDDL